MTGKAGAQQNTFAQQYRQQFWLKNKQVYPNPLQKLQASTPTLSGLPIFFPKDKIVSSAIDQDIFF